MLNIINMGYVHTKPNANRFYDHIIAHLHSNTAEMTHIFLVQRSQTVNVLKSKEKKIYNNINRRLYYLSTAVAVATAY